VSLCFMNNYSPTEIIKRFASMLLNLVGKLVGARGLEIKASRGMSNSINEVLVIIEGIFSLLW